MEDKKMNDIIYEADNAFVKRTGDYDFEVTVESKPGDAINKACELLCNAVDGEIWMAVTPTALSSDSELDKKGYGIYVVYFHLPTSYSR